MSLFAFRAAQGLTSHGFGALVMAALLIGRRDQVNRLRAAFPALATEFEARRRSLDGKTDAERKGRALCARVRRGHPPAIREYFRRRPSTEIFFGKRVH